MKDHGLILTDEHADYSDMTQSGTVTIAYNQTYGIEIYSEGFEFSETTSCRHSSMKALAWARDALIAAIARKKVAPGSDLSVGID